MDYKNTKRIFIFVDESGDIGDPQHHRSSKHFSINILLTTDTGIKELERLVSSFRFYAGYTKELKDMKHKTGQQVIVQSFEKIVLDGLSKLFTLEIDKTSSYFQRLRKQTRNDLTNKYRLRNFLLRISLEYIVQVEKLSNVSPIEVVIDRYLNNEVLEQVLKQYLMSPDNKLPKFDAVVQVDSRYCNAIQMVDMMEQYKKDLDILITRIPQQ